ncbi:type VI secretion system protein TssA [Paraburkholderia dinghuensis]|uniref:Type VI secretion system protein TssA n=1 Tax=Paraburkholderia dinghuensis TaxID=2305225 RepID=A0A3N6P787_9BURK|nr:type VI secretion system protein TssA [Paraburkholderia dinghuensis]RQH09903.1 type VI secretion system protein TssA [Paraburkholderia dinghuensis]
MTDTTALLAPINETSPCGADLLFSPDFDAIQRARRFDDASLDQGEWITEIKEADWPFVVERCTALLHSTTKDLRLAVWLTEALAIQEGVSGLTQGYALLTGLIEQYWEQVHPLPEGEDAEYRLGNVAWLAGRSAELLQSVPLTQSDVAFSAIDWNVAMHVAQAAKRDPDHADDIARGKPSVEQIDASKRATPASFYRTLLVQLRVFEAALAALDKSLDTRAGEAAPSFRQTREACESVYRLAERFARDVGVNLDEVEEALAAHPDGSSASAGRAEASFKLPVPAEDTIANPNRMPVRTHAGIQSRSEAVAQLRAVAVFFRETEPHSPAAYLADKAAEWAEMPLHQWLSTVVKDDGTLAHIREMLGVKTVDAG